MYTMIFDTETTDLNKCFCYNIGYVILDTDTNETVLTEDYVVEQIWHNLPLFETAYYSNKREQYVKDMKARKVLMKKFGYITQRMCRLIEEFDIQYAYAYNSSFDERVFNFNCEWFKCINPFDNVEIIDIRGLVHQTIAKSSLYQSFCEHYELFTDSGNYSTTAENIYRFILDDISFEECHTALADSVIETEILKYCVDECKCEYGKHYKTVQSIPRNCIYTLDIICGHTGEILYSTPYQKIRINKDRTEIVLK